MPKTDLVCLTCDYCGTFDRFDIRSNANELLPIISKWRGVMDGDAEPGRADSHRWYDCLDCLLAGEKQIDDRKKQAATDRNLAARASQAVAKEYVA